MIETETEITHPKPVLLSEYQVPVFLIESLQLNFELYDGHTLVSSRMSVRRNPASTQTSKDFMLNGEELTLLSVALNGKKLTEEEYSLTDKTLTIHRVPDAFELTIANKIFPEKNTELSGLYRSRDTYCTQCEAEGFRRITFFPDRPDILTRFTTTLSADQKRYPYLLSNGNLINRGTLEDGRHFATWEDPFKKPCYLFALVAGDFDVIEDFFETQSKRKVALRFYVEKGYGSEAHHALYSLKKAMQWDEETYGREYDLDVYMVVAIADFNMGAMENKGLNIFNTKYILAKPDVATDEDYIHILSVIGHEYFHNWTGNRVTCRDWFQLSLKEGLTVFRDQTFSEDILSSVMRIQDVNVLREAQFPEDAGPLAHSVRPESYIEINNFYTATIYNKGAEVLRMLRTILGVEKFREGMDLYFKRHDGQAVTIEDYVKAMEDVSGINLKQFKRWYSQAGTPIVRAEGRYDQNTKEYTLTLAQSCPDTPGQTGKYPFHIPVKMGLLDEEGSHQDTVLHLTEATQTFTFANIAKKPLPSLLRQFSAPVKLQIDYSDQDLMYLFKHDPDTFNRWEAGQQYATRLMLRFIEQLKKNNTVESLSLPSELISMFEYVLDLQKTHHDLYFLSSLLVLPSEKYIAEQMEVIEVELIHHVRQWMLSALAKQLEKKWLAVYLSHHDDSSTYQFDMKTIGRRQMKNRCLAYLLMLPQHAELGLKQFKGALSKNMTDTLAAMAGLANLDVPSRLLALDAFYQTFKQNALCVDKWFAIQAGSTLPNTLETVKQLMQHPAFDLKNPNKVYALVGAFSRRNLIQLHAKDGSGYAFLREVVQQLNKINPQIASRMLEPLTGFKRYDKERQQLMRKELVGLLETKNLSPDLYELLTKSLK